MVESSSASPPLPPQQQQQQQNQPKKKRAQAREQVALVWQQRRQQQQQQQPLKKKTEPSPLPQLQPQQAPTVKAKQPQPSAASRGCFFTYFEALFHHHAAHGKNPSKKLQQPSSARFSTTTVAAPEACSTTSSVKTTRRRTRFQSNENNDPHFPSLMAIHQAHALSKQIEILLQSRPLDDDEEEEELNDNDNDNSTEQESNQRQHVLQTTKEKQQILQKEDLLSVLPAGYNLDQAVFEMAKSRSRAFWLLDLATVVYRLVEWKRRYWFLGQTAATKESVQQHNPRVMFLFRLSANAHPILFNVLRRFDDCIAFVCSNAWDLEQCRSHFSSDDDKTKNDNAHHSWIQLLDDSTVTGKPDGYLRKALLPTGRGGPSPQRITCLAVDGPDEVHRIWNALQRIGRRRRQDLTETEWTACLRFPAPEIGDTATEETTTAILDQWHALWLETQQSLIQCRSCVRVEAISMDISFLLRQPGQGLELLESFCHHISSSVQTSGTRIRLELTGHLDLHDDQSMSFLSPLLKSQDICVVVDQICLDLTNSLLSSAGALCTRVIGVKQQQQQQKGKSESIPNESFSSRRQHYYIDDGCYGSLYQQQNGDESIDKKPFQPVPLILSKQTAGVHATNASSPPNTDQEYISTVWGPTCDGLDRVCQDILLPELHRDDWLVFPNQCNNSGEGLGTAFNGFCPPDTAYCVLGYFRN